MEFGQRVIALRTARGWSQGELARRAKVARSYLNSIEGGRSKRPGMNVVQRLATALEVEPASLTTEVQPPIPATEPVVRMSLLAQRIPGSSEWPVDDEYLPEIVADADKVAIRVKGDCMLPKIADGDTIIVDPHRAPALGNVIVWWSQGAWTLKRLRKRNGLWWLIPDNPLFDPVELDPATSRILGVVVRVVKPEP